jgi:hypothetical protein
VSLVHCVSVCDSSNDDAARETLSRATGRKSEPGFVRVERDQRLPQLVSFWRLVYDGNEDLMGVLYACCAYRDTQGPDGPAARVLGDLGWGAATMEKRVELARLYDTVAIQMLGGRTRALFSASSFPFSTSHPFVAPDARPLADGGVLITHWSSIPGQVTIVGADYPTAEFLELRFSAGGALAPVRVLDKVDADSSHPPAAAPSSSGYLTPGSPATVTEGANR